ncbi:uncharacterized protein EHS24_005702 [Apiotrichum porosum]|uniref:SH3 domain-containing protein n=1 Tax=Apiotrichum porosum TaxID=105984 RepID=A0A427XZF4_9TREE|nr:uncharacterized protein EHS24_005702 [Apiotrichum porosum]RSH84193.1 hypothetical protein EHS24_005702 [Apiotrichum porosum]
MFANLSYEDKHAFFALLDEYFESRPHLRPAAGGSNGGGITLNAGHAKAAAAAFTAATATQSGRGAPSGPPVVPSRTYRAEESEAVAEPAPPAWSPAAHSPTASGQSPSKPSPMVSAKGYMSSGMNKMSNNDTLNKGLGKIGAGNFTSRMSDRFSASSGPYVAPRSTPREPSAESGAGGAAPTPPPSRTAPPARGGPVAGLQSSKSFGHVDTGSGGSAFTSMWRDPNKVQAPTTNARMAPALGVPKVNMPPPTRRVGAGAGAASGTPSPEPAAAAGEGQAQALYDYPASDATDLEVQEGQIVTIVAKTSADWWTCEDGNGKQGLVPANYMKEL